MNRNKVCHVLFALVCTFVFFAIAQTVVAQEPSFGLAPYSIEKKEVLPHIDYSLEAGQSATGAVLVTNPGEKAAYLRLSATDAQTSMHGGVSFPDTGEPVAAVGGWISLSETELILQPHEERVIPFTISVPADAWVGEHRAGILLELTDPDTARPADFPEGQIYVGVRFRKALNVRVTVPGPLAVDFKITSVEHVFESGRSVFQVTLRNDGNVATEMIGGQLEVLDAQKQVIGMQPIRMSGKFLARDTVLHPVLFDQPLPEGQYGVRASMNYGNDELATWESTFEVTNQAAEEARVEAINSGFNLPAQPTTERVNYWMYAVLGLIVLAVVVGGVWFIRRKRSKGDGGSA